MTGAARGRRPPSCGRCRRSSIRRRRTGARGARAPRARLAPPSGRGPPEALAPHRRHDARGHEARPPIVSWRAPLRSCGTALGNCWRSATASAPRSRRISRGSASTVSGSPARSLRTDLAAVYAAADLFVWPACAPKASVCMLQARPPAPLVAGQERWRRRGGRRWPDGALLTPRDPDAFAARLAACSTTERRRPWAAAARFVAGERSLAQAAALAPRSRRRPPSGRCAVTRSSLIRHGPTAWNASGAHPGAGRCRAVARRTCRGAAVALPDTAAGARRSAAQPARRARETAAHARTGTGASSTPPDRDGLGPSRGAARRSARRAPADGGE